MIQFKYKFDLSYDQLGYPIHNCSYFVIIQVINGLSCASVTNLWKLVSRSLFFSSNSRIINECVVTIFCFPNPNAGLI